MDELTEKYLARFMALASERIQRATEMAADRLRDRAAAVVHDMHALGGESGLLGLEGVIDVARRAEEAARRFGETGAEADALALAEHVKSLERAVTRATTGSRSP
jgi:hypothetical protein